MAIGAALGAGVSALTGIGQMTAGAVQKKKADKMMPGMEDPEERAALEAVKQQARSARTGTDATTAANLRTIEQGARNTQRAIQRNTGGDVGSTISGMLQAQRTAGNQANQAYGQAAQRGNYFQSLGDQMRSNIVQRKLELGMYKSQQQRATATANQQSGFQNLSQGGMSLLGMLPQGGQETSSTRIPQAAPVQTPMLGNVSSLLSTPQIQNRPPTAVSNYTGEEVDMSNVNAPTLIDNINQNAMVRPQGY